VSVEEIEQNHQRFGCYHVALGRVLHGHHHAALDEPNMDRPAPGIEPVRHAIEGARSFASKRGLDDPHSGINYQAVRTHRGLVSDLAHEYDKLPANDPSAVHHFDAMRDEVNHQYDHLTHAMGVKVHVTDHDPYRNVHELAHDVRNNKRIQVLGTHATGGHPYFSDSENDRFRAVHDVFGHLATGRDFDRHGEEAAYQAHARMFSHHARPALASETRGQNGSLIVNGKFGPQKIAVMPSRLWHPDLAHQGNLTRTAEVARIREGVPNSIMEPGRDYPVVGRDQSNGGHTKYVVLDTGKGRGNYIWAPEHHVHVSTLADDYRLHRVDQERRAEQAGHGYGEETRAFYGDPNAAKGDTSEKSLTYKDYLHHMRQPREEEERPQDHEWYRGHDLGAQHADEPEHADFGELDRGYLDSPHPEHFFKGYQHGWSTAMPEHQASIAVHHGWATREGAAYGPLNMPKIVRVGHVSGNSIDVLHCPFCGSGAVIARSDGTIECNFCTSVFTVQVQPQFAAFPQTTQGQPYPWPGQPDPASVVSPGGAAMPGDPMGAGGIGGAPADIAPDMPGGELGVDPEADPDAPPWAQGDAADVVPGDDTGGDDEAAEDDSAPPFAKGKSKGDDKDPKDSDDKGKAKVHGKDKPPFAKKKSSYHNSRGAELGESDYLRHLAILHAHDPRAMAEQIKRERT